jgi:hypothetical protein
MQIPVRLNYTALKQVSLMINEPSLTSLGSWRLTAVLNVCVETWIGNAAAVLSGAWGAVTRRAHQSGYSRTAVYMHAQRVVQAVASAQAGGISYDALWHENERLKAENDALWQAWAEAEELRVSPKSLLCRHAIAEWGINLGGFQSLEHEVQGTDPQHRFT